MQGIMLYVPGDLIGLESLWTPPSEDVVITVAASVLEHVDVKVLSSVFLEDRDVATFCMRRVIEEKRRLEAWIGALGHGSAEERMAMLLLEVHQRLADSRRIAPEALTFPFPLTQMRTACLLGMTQVHVNRVFRSLRERGVAAHRVVRS